MTITDARIAELDAKIELAHKEVNDVCQRTWNGDHGAWRMTIPADRERDSDLVISAGLAAQHELLTALRAERELSRKRHEALQRTCGHPIATYVAEKKCGNLIACYHCGNTWREYEPKSHKPGCLATPEGAGV